MKPKKSPRKGLVKSCDELWSKVVRGRNPTCIWCNNHPSRQAHHIFSRKFTATRHLTENGAALCGGCHMKAHREPDEFIIFIQTHLGEGQYRNLKVLAYSKMSKPDYSLRLIQLTLQMGELDSAKDKKYEFGGVG